LNPMKGTANFLVNPRLAALLGENYRSSEHAIKELVDNAWDADAGKVWIELPSILSDAPVIVRDDGTGMKEEEVRLEYLNIANARFARKGEKTPAKGRPVKGRKGIGKFAGLIAAAVMEVETCTQGRKSRLIIEKEQLLAAQSDLEQVPLQFEWEDCAADEHGTVVTLKHLNQNFSAPQPDKLKSLLVLEYGRDADFAIFVNGERVAHEDLSGEKHLYEFTVPNAGPAKLSYTIMEDPRGASRAAGIALRVGGKIIGRPHWFGLEEDADLPAKLLKRVVGELTADNLEDDVTADFGAIIENSRAYQEVLRAVQPILRQSLETTLTTEVNLAKSRLQQEVSRRLEPMPEYRRQFAARQLDQIMRKFFGQGEKEERVRVLVGLVLDTFEKDEYWAVCRRLEATSADDEANLSGALQEFGSCDLAFSSQQAQRRLEFLDSLERLARNKKTSPPQLRAALEGNCWVFGSEYAWMSTSKALKKVTTDYVNKHFKSNPADLLLSQNAGKRYLLVEFMPPGSRVGKEAEAQAKKHADQLGPKLGRSMEILIIGGAVEPGLRPEYSTVNVKFASYDMLIAEARNELKWLLKELSQKPF
jgi:hypothetical protein